MGVHMFPILNTLPTSLPIPSLWVVPVHQPRASCIMHQTWTGDSFHIYYTWFNAILPNHPTLSLSHRVQKTVSPLSPSSRDSGSSLLSALMVVSSTSLRLLIFLLAILIPACASSSPAFHIMYSAYKLNKQGDNISLDVLLSLFRTSLLFHVQF